MKSNTKLDARTRPRGAAWPGYEIPSIIPNQRWGAKVAGGAGLARMCVPSRRARTVLPADCCWSNNSDNSDNAASQQERSA